MGKSVVVSSVRPLKGVVDNAQRGLVFEEYIPALPAEAVIKLGDEDLRRRLRENARKAAKDC